MDWTDISWGDHFSQIYDITYVTGSTWVLVRHGSIEQSTDNGDTWAIVDYGLDSGGYRCVASAGGTVIVGGTGNQYVYSTDYGATFSAVQTGPYVAALTSYARTFGSITYIGGIFMSAADGWISKTSAGISWTAPIDTLGASQSLDFGVGQWVVVPFVGYTGYARSYDTGSSWEVLSYGSPVLDMDVARYSNTHNLWVGTGRPIGGGSTNLFVSTDTTATAWTGTTVNTAGARAVGFYGDLAVIGRYGSAGKRMVTSSDLVTWVDETSPFDEFNRNVLAFDSGNGRIIAVGSGGVIAYRAPTSVVIPSGSASGWGMG